MSLYPIIESNTMHITFSTSEPPSVTCMVRQTTPLGETKNENTTPLTPSAPRKCTHCGQSRQGHANSGCPNVNPPIPPKPRSPGDNSPRRRSPTNAFHQVTNNTVVHNNYYVSPRPGTADRPTSTHTTAAAGTPDATNETTRDAPAAPSGSGTTRARQPVVRTLSEEERREHLRELERTHPSLVYTLSLAEDELRFEASAARKHGYAVKILAPEGSWSDETKGVLIIGKDEDKVQRHYSRVQRAARDGAPMKDTLEGLGMILGVFKDIVTAWMGGAVARA